MKKIIARRSLFLGFLFMISCTREFTKTEHGFIAQIDSSTVEIQFYSPEIVRVIKSKQGFTYEKNSLSVIKKPEKVAFTLSEQDNVIEAKTNALTVKLDITNGQISYISAKKENLLMEQANGALFESKEDIGEATFRVKQTFTLDKDEYIYGLGQYMEGRMSQRNQTLKMIQDNKETVVPFMLSNKNYGVYWDNYSPTIFADSAEASCFDSEVGDCIDYYFMAGKNADGVIAQMRDLSGQAPMMPYWTFGFWQSKERYKSEDETVGVIEKYRKLGIPIDGIIQDWQYWGDNLHWNAMEFLNPNFSNPKKMIDDIHKLNAHIIISCWASFGRETQPFKALSKKNMLMDFMTWPIDVEGGWPPDYNNLSGVKVYDAYHPEARDIYWSYLNKGIFSLGMDGWWLDSSEPDHIHPKEEDYNNKTYLGSLRRVRNAFPIAHVGGVATHQKETTKEKRVFILTRSAFAGQQRYSANSWSGDVTSNWDMLRHQISAGLNFSLTGIPYWNSDIGGFFVRNFPGGYKNKAYHEIYVRWMQFGAFCPMMRSHGTDTPRELWYYGKEGDWAYDALKKSIDLRYSLLPYIYSTSWEVTKNKSTMMRALVMDFPDDKKALDINKQYMFGKNILVSPVTEPMYVKYKIENQNYIATKEDFNEVKTSKVYLPSGVKWFNFWTGEVKEGGQTIDCETPIDILPLYVKAGSIIPFGPNVQYANEEIGPLTIRVYPGADASFTFYDDERDNYNYEEGAYATIEMKWNDSTHTLTLETQKGQYIGMPKSRKISIIKVDKHKATGLPYGQQADKVINYTGSKVDVKL